MSIPRMFALTRSAGQDDTHVVGYGLVLPDGSAFSVSWPGSGAHYSASSAEETAELRRADLQWIGDQR